MIATPNGHTGGDPAGSDGIRAAGDHFIRRARPYVLITGGAGFIGANLADRLLERGERVLIYDRLSRPGVEANLRWLCRKHGTRARVLVADVRDRGSVRRAVRHAAKVYHFAAQVAVTRSLADPVEDFEVNAWGTLNVLEAVRARHDPPPLLFTSTNKVYGALSGLALGSAAQRYEPSCEAMRAAGIGEGQTLDFHSPYGCSKGAADQMVRDYARSYGLHTVVFRMSCIYGPHQCGNEDQGWVAHFLRQALEDRPITIFGDGKQVRDVLHVDDLIDAMLLALAQGDRIAGEAFNIGGGPENVVSLLDLISMIETLQQKPVELRLGRWRVGDQRYYVSDISRYREATGWSPRIDAHSGVAKLHRWLLAEAQRLARPLFPQTAARQQRAVKLPSRSAG